MELGPRKTDKAVGVGGGVITHTPATIGMAGGNGTGSLNGGFWRKSSIALPGRPNPSKVNSPTTTFQDFEQSVSDVWDINEDEAAAAAASAAGASGSPPSNTSSSMPAAATPNSQQQPKFIPPHQLSTQQLTHLLLHNKTPAGSTPTGSANNHDHHAPGAAMPGTFSTRRPSDIASHMDQMSLRASDKSNLTKTPSNTETKKFAKLELLMESTSVELEELRRLAWSGISPRSRAKAWKILCGYLPGNSARQQEAIQRKQEEYFHCVEQYFLTKDQDVHQDTYRQIHIDIPRMSPVVGLFQQRCVQEIFERILYIWAIRHPASGYVQGINDLVTPFFLVFLQDCANSSVAGHSSDNPVNILDATDLVVETFFTKEQRDAVEADSYWCLTTILAGIQDNYTFAQPGIQLKVRQLEELVQRIDKQLHEHLVSHEVVYLQFAFRWMNNILMRELPIKATIRLWDTYLAQADGFSHFHLYVCAAFLIHWKVELLKKTDFHTLLMFLQNLPTAKWGDNEINLLVAEAYRLSYLFKDAPSHLATRSLSASSTTT